jgi:hypothetical protein
VCRLSSGQDTVSQAHGLTRLNVLRLCEYICGLGTASASTMAGQPGHSMGLERLGFNGDTWAALRAGLRAALRSGPRPVTLAEPRAALCVGPPSASFDTVIRRLNGKPRPELDIDLYHGHPSPETWI